MPAKQVTTSSPPPRQTASTRTRSCSCSTPPCSCLARWWRCPRATRREHTGARCAELGWLAAVLRCGGCIRAGTVPRLSRLPAIVLACLQPLQPCMFVAGVLYLLGSGLQAGALNLAMLISGRCVLGLGVGISAVTAPCYIAELAPFASRGGLATLVQAATVSGILAAQVQACLPSCQPAGFLAGKCGVGARRAPACQPYPSPHPPARFSSPTMPPNTYPSGAGA